MGYSPWNRKDSDMTKHSTENTVSKKRKKRLGAHCGSDHELLIAKFRLKLKEVWKSTRPFTYDLNQIPYDYTVELANRFKGLDLKDRMPEELGFPGHVAQGERGGPRKPVGMVKPRPRACTLP